MSETAFNSFVYDLPSRIPVRKTGAKVIVEFRTSGSYQGEYGFDWIRMGDSGRLGDTWYAKIMGNEFTSGWDRDLIVDKTKRVYDNYASHLFRTKRFVIPWKTYGKHPFMYVVPLMTLRKGASAKLSLKVEVREPAVKIEYKCQTPGIFKLSKTSIPKLGKGKHTLPDELVITCLKEFSMDQEINVYAYDANKMKHLAGKLIVKANDKKHQKTINVAIVYVKLKKVESSPDVSSSIMRLKKIFEQAYVNLNIHKVPLSIAHTLNNKAVKKFFTPQGSVYEKYIDDDTLFSFLNVEFSKKYPNLGSFFKLYYINRPCSNKNALLYGQARKIKSHEVIILFKGLKDNTAAHELLHCVGLPHSFSYLNAEYSHVAFKECSTDNIMDYSDFKGIPVIATWEFQWKAIQKNISDLHAGKW